MGSSKEPKLSNQDKILEAMFVLRDRKGISLQALKKYVGANFGEIKSVSAFRKALQALVVAGALSKEGTQRYKLDPEKKKEIVKSKKPKKPKKKVVKKKKTKKKTKKTKKKTKKKKPAKKKTKKKSKKKTVKKKSQKN